MTLQFNVSQLLKDNVGDTRQYDFDSDEVMDIADGTATDVHGHVKFILTNFGIVVRGEADAVLHLTCARCLESTNTPIHVHFEEEYQPAIDIATGLPSSTPMSEDAFVISQNHTLDLTEAVRQNLVVAVEIIPLCRPDCKGLCPTCGVNHNNEACHCPPPENTSPFAVLQGLISDNNTA